VPSRGESKNRLHFARWPNQGCDVVFYQDKALKVCNLAEKWIFLWKKNKKYKKDFLITLKTCIFAFHL